ncbi:MAG TPA: hypothetical protein VEP90_22175, partial [Methylomirabilota bacterium]|nr:hypothetical protein [Methylomirabilota bacterium]
KRDLLVVPVAFVVLVVWIASLIGGLITQSFIALTLTTPVMILLAGWVFGINIVKRSNGGNENG